MDLRLRRGLSDLLNFLGDDRSEGVELGGLDVVVLAAAGGEAEGDEEEGYDDEGTDEDSDDDPEVETED